MEVTTVETVDVFDSPDNAASFYVYIVLSALGLIGNAFVCLVMLRYRNVFNSTTNRLIFHQSAVDFLGSCMFILQKSLKTSPPDNAIGTLYCTMWWSEWYQWACFVASTYNLLAISMERYLATCHPIRHRNMLTRRRLNLIMATAWICGVALEFHLVLNVFQRDGACHDLWPSPVVQAVTGVVIFLFEIFLPLVAIIFAYTKIILELRRRSKVRINNSSSNNNPSNIFSKANKNITKTLIVVAIFFTCCWTPGGFTYLFYNFGWHGYSFGSFLDQVTGAAVVANLCVNPIIYCFTYDRFRTQARKMFRDECRRCNNQVDNSNDSRTARTGMVQTIA
ncbi:galanin receptor type 2-like [Acanthaster planci]|uniref:Galanin receptor type 2-like n=1 Tax=Acanthaster planci TaxID=133434 RepID=A0A8B7XX05_ACAPL|nr:galanin receptor type 2-like [Acanthaster planci]